MAKKYKEKRCYELALEMNPRCAKAWSDLSMLGGGVVGDTVYNSDRCLLQKSCADSGRILTKAPHDLGSWPRRVVVARHGRRQVKGPDNWSLNLTDSGRNGVSAMAAWLKSPGVRFGRILSSPFPRCRQTAELLATNSGTEVELDPGLT